MWDLIVLIPVFIDYLRNCYQENSSMLIQVHALSNILSKRFNLCTKFIKICFPSAVQQFIFMMLIWNNKVVRYPFLSILGLRKLDMGKGLLNLS